MTTHTLRELNEFIKRVLSVNLPDALWISGEIAQIGRSRGHFYIEIVEKDDLANQIVAQAQAILWASNYRFLKQKNGTSLDSILKQGIQVLFKVTVDFNERYGLKLIIEDIDPAYTLGQLELKRRQTIQELQAKSLLDKNAALALPMVMQRVAVISSERAAGYQDFVTQLANNEYGYHIHTQLFQAAMQGEMVEQEVSKALDKIRKKQGEFDAVVIIRGGGAKLDLAAFDSLLISKMIANFPLPVLTGIGHEIDETVADLVAHTKLKTPTAVADFLINRLVEFESYLLEFEKNIIFLGQQHLNNAQLLLEQYHQHIALQAQLQLRQAKQQLAYMAQEIPKLAYYQLKAAHQLLDNIAHNIHLLSPEYALQRGFTMTIKDGKPVNFEDLLKNDEIETIFAHGKIKSKII